jgi:hypothetical protein
MSKAMACAFVCLVAPGLAAAQDEVIKDFSPKQVEKFIKDGMKADVLDKRQTADGKGLYYSTPGQFFDVEYRQAPRKTLVFQYQYKDRKATLETLNDWNGRDGNLTRAFRKNGKTVLAAVLDVDAGASFAQLTTFYERIDQERKDFDEHTTQPGGGAGGGDEPPKGADGVRQTFPAKAEQARHRTAWDVEWDFVPNHNGKVFLLRIKSARFHFKDNKGQWKSVVVARNLQLAEAFASYDDGITSFLDLAVPGRADLNVPAREDLKGPNCVLPGEILRYSKNPQLTVYREVHDDGVRWITGFGKPDKTRKDDNKGYRGEKLILTSVFQAVNYVYLVEYDFTDDGRVVSRLGFTAHNYFNRGHGSDNVADGDVHLHVGCWRMEFDLGVRDAAGRAGGPALNDYRLISRRHDGRRWRVVDEPFGADVRRGENAALEGKAEWKPQEFTTLRVRSATAKNAHGRPISYDLISSRMGSVRNLLPTSRLDTKGKNMDWVNYDFWVTHTPAKKEYYEVASLAQERNPLQGRPAVVWYSAPALHVPRGEDYGGDSGEVHTRGVALTTWIEFTLRPRDLFDSTPLYP